MEGCQEVLPLSGYDSHVRDCLYQFVPCPFGPSCGEFRKKDLPVHLSRWDERRNGDVKRQSEKQREK